MRIDKLLTLLFLLGVSNVFGQCGETGYFHLDYHGIVDEFETDNSNHVIAAVRIQNSTTLIKVDDSRNILQELDMGDISSWAKVDDITIDPDDNIYICGSFQANLYLGPGFSYAGPGGFVAKLNTNFEVQWVKISQNANPRTITVDSNNGLYVGFFTGPTFVFQGQTYSTPVSGYYVCLFRLNATNGTPVWNKRQRTNGSTSEAICRLEASDDFGVYEVVNFDQYFWDEFGVYYPATNASFGDLNAIVCYYDAQGNRGWIKRMVKGEVMATSKTSDGNLALYCEMGNDYLSVGTDTLYSYFRESAGYMEFTTNGNLALKKRIISSEIPNYLVSERCGIDCLPDGGFLVSGRTQQALNFNGILGPTTNQNIYNNTFFVARYDSIGTIRWARTFGQSALASSLIDQGIRVMNECSAYFVGYTSDEFRYDENNGDTIPMGRIPFLLEFDLETGLLATDSSLNGGGGNWTDDPFGPNGVGLDELTDENLSVYPNPVSSLLTIKTKETSIHYNWELYNEIGKKIRHGEDYGSSEIDVRDLPSGLYLMKITNDQNSVTKKVTKY